MRSKLVHRHGQFAIHHQAPTEDRKAVLRQAHEMRTTTSGFTRTRNARILMEIPPILEMKMMEKYGPAWFRLPAREKLKKYREAEFAGLRTTEGRF